MALFRINGSVVKKITVKDLDLEKNLQGLFESNLEEILNIVFLSHEYSTSFGGRIDTLGIDKNGSPCIIEYKKSQNDNVINQGLSYLRWLLDHKADFEILCQDKKVNIEIDWDSPRVICIAESYNKFDLDTADILPINIGQLKDPKGLARDLKRPKPIGHWGNGDYEVKLEKENEIDSVFELIKQSYDLNK